MFSELTIEEADDDQELDNKMAMAAKALGRNELSENKIKQPEEQLPEEQEEDENDNPYLEEETKEE